MLALRFVLIGAPAVGKSTLLQRLAHHGNCQIFELETYGPPENWSVPGPRPHRDARLEEAMRLAAQPRDVPLFITCADLNYPTFLGHYELICLHYPTLHAYMERVRRRAHANPEKAGQNEETNYQHAARFRAKHTPLVDINPQDFEGDFDGLARFVWREVDPGGRFRF